MMGKPSGNRVPMQGIGDAMQSRFGGQGNGQQQPAMQPQQPMQSQGMQQMFNSRMTQPQQANGSMLGQNIRQMFANGNRPQGGAGGHQMFANGQQQWQPKQQMQTQQWQPQNLQQAWGHMNNPNQFAQQQAMMQQALQQRQAQALQNMPQRAATQHPGQQPIDNRRFLTGDAAYWDNYVG